MAAFDDAGDRQEGDRDHSQEVLRRVMRTVLIRLLIVLAACAAIAGAIVWGVIYSTPLDAPIATVEKAPRETESLARSPHAVRQPAVSLASVPVPATSEQLQREAEQTANELRNRYPNSAEALHVVAMMHSQLRHTNEAEKLWQKCIELAPQNETYYINLAAVMMDRGNSQLAVEILRRAISVSSSSPDVLHHLAVALTDLGKFEEAEEAVQKALKVEPHFPSAWLVLGQAQLKLGTPAEAEESLRNAMSQGVRSAELYFALAGACARQGKDQEAAEFRESFSELTASQPLDPQQRFQILSTAEARRTAVAVLTEAAFIHNRQRDSLEAERLLLRAIALDPVNAGSCQALANLYQEAGMSAEERVVRRRLVEIEPLRFERYLNLAKVSAQLGEPETAEATLKMAIAVKPEAAMGYVTLAEFYVEAGKAKQARWYAQEAVRRQPSAEGYELLASTCRLLGDHEGAKNALALARKLDIVKPRPEQAATK